MSTRKIFVGVWLAGIMAGNAAAWPGTEEEATEGRYAAAESALVAASVDSSGKLYTLRYARTNRAQVPDEHQSPVIKLSFWLQVHDRHGQVAEKFNNGVPLNISATKGRSDKILIPRKVFPVDKIGVLVAGVVEDNDGQIFVSAYDQSGRPLPLSWLGLGDESHTLYYQGSVYGEIDDIGLTYDNQARQLLVALSYEPIASSSRDVGMFLPFFEVLKIDGSPGTEGKVIRQRRVVQLPGEPHWREAEISIDGIFDSAGAVNITGVLARADLGEEPRLDDRQGFSVQFADIATRKKPNVYLAAFDGPGDEVMVLPEGEKNFRMLRATRVDEGHVSYLAERLVPRADGDLETKPVGGGDLFFPADEDRLAGAVDGEATYFAFFERDSDLVVMQHFEPESARTAPTRAVFLRALPVSECRGVFRAQENTSL